LAPNVAQDFARVLSPTCAGKHLGGVATSTASVEARLSRGLGKLGLLGRQLHPDRNGFAKPVEALGPLSNLGFAVRRGGGYGNGDN
jgi:hypothetical protein